MTLRDLLERVERATGPDRELDRAIWKACGIDYRQSVTQPVTSSVDAALTLIGRVLPGWRVLLDSDNDRRPLWSARAKRNGQSWDAIGHLAPTPALALCAALIAAMIEQEGINTADTPTA